VVEPLAEREVHVWVARLDEPAAPELLAAYHALLDPEERERHGRFRFERHRHVFLVSHALLRLALSRYSTSPPQSWSFQRNAYGRPELAPGACERPLRFNLSHTDGLACLAITLDRDVGIDVESPLRRGEAVAVAERYFSPAEVRALRSLPEHAQRDRFFDYWTLKEAYIKARGLGLSLPLERFSFELGSPIRIAFDPRLRDRPESWQFELMRPTPQHRMALAVRRGRGPDLAVSVRAGMPPRG
jgi:4'-phosphopantetheinyl transferase